MKEYYRGLRITEIPELAGRVEKVDVDAINWITRYRDPETGECWEESYESTGHGDVVVVRKVNSSRSC